MLSHEKIYSNIYKNVRGVLTFVIYCILLDIRNWELPSKDNQLQLMEGQVEIVNNGDMRIVDN